MWCKTALLFGLVAVCVATPSNPAAAADVPYSPQEKFLAKSFSGNFACRVNSVEVTPKDLPEAAFIRSAVANVATLEWAHIAQTSFASLDGRNEEKVLGTPGGDMGEFIQALHAYSSAANKTLSADDISAVFERYLTVMSRPKFFYETDEKAYVSLAIATGCRNLHISEMGGMRHKREEVLKRITAPEYIGDPFIKFLATNASDLGIRTDYIYGALAAYHKVLWTTPSKLSSKLCYLEMKGPHKHVALVNVVLPSFCTDQGLAPMISQQLGCNGPVLVNHADAAKILRRELVTVLTAGKTDVDPRNVLEDFDRLAEENFGKFWASFGGDLPTLKVEFLNTSPLLSQDVSFVDDE